jgi:hypothetical protein
MASIAAATDLITIHVTADASADTLARIANVVLLANVLPSRVSLQTQGDEVRLQIELRDVEASVVERIRRKLMQLTCVMALELR